VAKRKKFSVWIHGGIHAREWISVTSAIFVMDQILQIQLSDHDPENVLRFCDWYFVPLVNPDGYNFSRSRPENKMWRKNRHVSSNECEGVDLNRNWDFKWKGSGCDDTYAGPRPFSEPETRGLRDILDGLAEVNSMIRRMLNG
jgi:murein tripeptide amidase MpaA